MISPAAVGTTVEAGARGRLPSQPVKKAPVRESIESGDLRVGNVFPLPVHGLVAETIPPVRTPPGKS